MEWHNLGTLLNAQYIYEGGKNLSFFIAGTITPVLLVINLWIRLARHQMDTLTAGQGKWSALAKDLAIWLPILGLYFALAHLLSGVLQPIYNAFSSFGTLGQTFDLFKKLLEVESPEASVLSFVSNLSLILPWMLYYLSSLIASIIIIFMKMAHAVAYSIALCWGLIAIPLSIGGFKVLRGWAILGGTVLLWPIMHYMCFALFNPVFSKIITSIDTGTLGDTSVKLQFYLLLNIINFITAAISISAPFIASALINNSGAIGSIVTPMATAALATAAIAAQTTSKHMQQNSNKTDGGSHRKRYGTQQTPQPDKTNPTSRGSHGSFSPTQQPPTPHHSPRSDRHSPSIADTKNEAHDKPAALPAPPPSNRLLPPPPQLKN